MTQYIIRPKRSAIHAQAVYFLHSTMNVTYVPATEWCKRYLLRYLFSVSNSVCFSSIYRSPGSACTAPYWF